MKIEKTEIWITCYRPIEGDSRAVRGFLGICREIDQSFIGRGGRNAFNNASNS